MAAPEPPKTGWVPGAPSDLDDLDVLADVVQIGEQAPKKKPEPDQGSVLAGGGSENETPSAGPALRTGSDEAVEDAAKQGRLAATGGAPPSTGPALPAGSDKATEDRTEQGRLAATGELLPESAPPAAEEKPSLGVRTPKDEFEASRQGTLIENQQHA
jgi:hypothetical protein